VTLLAVVVVRLGRWGSGWRDSADPHHGWLVGSFFVDCCVLWGGRPAGDFREKYVRALRVCIFNLILCTRAIRTHFMCTPVVLQVICFFIFYHSFCLNQKLQIFLFSKNVEEITNNRKKIKYRSNRKGLFWRCFFGAPVGLWACVGRTLAHNPRNPWAQAHFWIQANLHHFIGIKCINEDTTINQ